MILFWVNQNKQGWTNFSGIRDMLDDITLGIVAIFASILILIGWVPQIIQGYKTKKLEDDSKY